MYIHTYVHTYIHAYIHTCIHTYMHTYIHANKCMYILVLLPNYSSITVAMHIAM